MPHARRMFGDRGEEAAVAALARHGIATVERNVRSRFGEIDLVCRDRRGYVFVEVKTRSSASFVAAAEAVDRRKLRRMARCAHAWLAARGQTAAPWRLAVLALTVSGDMPSVDLRDVDELAD